jgi:peptidoglycan/xylan/chitin deacetylase (PgdA/CDA1 family)
MLSVNDPSPQNSSALLKPRVVISLDFEMRWGVHDVYGLDIDAYRANLEAERTVIPALLRLFADHQVRTTWATVGAIGCSGWQEYFDRAPPAPAYADSRFAVKAAYADIDPDGTLHFAPDLMRAILQTPGQELGTHTFSHVFLRERGVTAQDAAADLAAATRLHEERFDGVPRSLVFPRNQPAFIGVVRTSSVRIWRGNAAPWYYDCEDSEHNGLLPRALKLIDAFNPLTKRAARLVGDMNRASLFLRLNLPAPAWGAHVYRIRAELDALKADEILHLWFHPHNLGTDIPRGLGRIEEVVSLIQERQTSGSLRSATMSDLIPASQCARRGGAAGRSALRHLQAVQRTS